jgi:hypothetical protein
MRAFPRPLLILLALALLVRLPLLPFPGFFGDMQNFVTWGQIADTNFWHFYSAARRATGNYPPLAHYLFGVQIWLWVHGRLLLGHQTGLLINDSPGLAAWLKLPLLPVDLVTIWLLYREARSLLSERKALLVTALYAFNPFVLVMGAMWGQLEPVFLLFLILGLLATLARHPRRVGIYLALACLVKPQPIIFLPLLFVWLARHSGWRKVAEACIAFIGVTLIGWSPYLLPLSPRPEVFAFLSNSAAWELTNKATTGSANLWWLLSPDASGKAPLLGPLSPDMLGFLFFAPVAVLAIAGIWRDRSPGALFLAALLTQVASFTLLALQHSRFLFPALALALLAALMDRRLWIAFGALWVILTSNLCFHILYYDPYHVNLISPALEQWVQGHKGLLVIAADVTAWLNLLVLAGLLAVQVARLRQQRKTEQQPVRSPEASEGLASSAHMYSLSE